MYCSHFIWLSVKFKQTVVNQYLVMVYHKYLIFTDYYGTLCCENSDNVQGLVRDNFDDVRTETPAS